MTRPAWETLSPEQQRAEWNRWNARQAAYVPSQRQPSPSPSPSPIPTQKRRDPWPIVAGLVCSIALVIFILIAISPGKLTVTGDVNVLGNTSVSSYSTTSASCSTYGGYNDIAEGASVTVRDASDAIVGIGSLSAGTSSSGSCVFAFTVPDVPESAFYSIEVSKRGALTYSADDVETGNVHQSLSSY